MAASVEHSDQIDDPKSLPIEHQILPVDDQSQPAPAVSVNATELRLIGESLDCPVQCGVT